MTSPADTIREALEWFSHTAGMHSRVEEALAALTELEAERDRALDRETGTQDALDSMRADRDRLDKALTQETERAIKAEGACFTAMQQATDAEADRDQWKNRAEYEDDQKRIASKAYLDMQADRDRYREALEQINHLPFDVNKTAPEDLMAIKEIARAALTTPEGQSDG